MRRALLLVLLSAGGCSSGSDSGGPTCDALGGAWTVTYDLGSGLVASERWDVAQAACELTVTSLDACATCGCGPGVGPEGASGWAGTGGLRTSWICYRDACRYTFVLEATGDAAALAGSTFWIRSAYGAGYCPSGYGQYATTVSRP